MVSPLPFDSSAGAGAGWSAAAAAVVAGSSTSTVVPLPGDDLISMLPPVCVTIPYTVASPSPVPSPFGLVE